MVSLVLLFLLPLLMPLIDEIIIIIPSPPSSSRSEGQFRNSTSFISFRRSLYSSCRWLTNMNFIPIYDVIHGYFL
jgi:hypothetical protein